jgi:AcrR family transcriptional regulator
MSGLSCILSGDHGPRLIGQGMESIIHKQPSDAPTASERAAKQREASGGRRRLSQARAEATRSRILHCARQVFAAHGFAAANVRDIARAAGTTHSMITYHFGSKDELWREAVRDMFALLQRQVIDPVEAEAELDFEQRFRKLVHLYTRYSAEHPEHARITVSETIAGGERLEWMVREFVSANQAATTGNLTQLLDRGLVPDMPLPSLLYAMVGMIQLPFMLQKEAQLAMGYDFMTDEAVEAHAEAVARLLTGTVHGPATRKSPS